MKTSQFLSLSLCGVGLLGLAAGSLYCNAKKDETIACLTSKLLEMESRVTLLENLPGRVMALETLPSRLDAVETLTNRVVALEGMPSRMAALETLPARIQALELLPERIGFLEAQMAEQGETVGKLLAVSPAAAPNANPALRQVANRLLQYGVLTEKQKDTSFLDSLARVENGDMGLNDYPFIASMISNGTVECPVPASCVQAFLAAGADPKALFEQTSSLVFAVQQQNLAVVNMLLQAGVDVNAPDASGTTPLMFAVDSEDNDVEIVKALLAAGADATRENSAGEKALDWCEKSAARELLQQVAPAPAPQPAPEAAPEPVHEVSPEAETPAPEAPAAE